MKTLLNYRCNPKFGKTKNAPIDELFLAEGFLRLVQGHLFLSLEIERNSQKLRDENMLELSLQR